MEIYTSFWIGTGQIRIVCSCENIHANQSTKDGQRWRKVRSDHLSQPKKDTGIRVLQHRQVAGLPHSVMVFVCRDFRRWLDLDEVMWLEPKVKCLVPLQEGEKTRGRPHHHGKTHEEAAIYMHAWKKISPGTEYTAPPFWTSSPADL